MVFIFFILTLLSSLSAVIFVNADFNLAFAKKSSHSGGGGSKDNGNGDNVGSNGGSGDNTTTPSIAQGNITSPETSINAPLTTQQQYPMTPQQKYEQCLSGIGGGIPGNCKPPSATITEQNASPQTLTPQQTCQDGSTPSANGICQDGSIPQRPCPGGVGRDAAGICFNPVPVTPYCPTHYIRENNGNCISEGNEQYIRNGTLVEIGGGKFRLGTVQPVPNTNTIAPICPYISHLELGSCVLNGAGCPPGTIQDDGDITCSPVNQVHVPVNPDGNCPPGSYSLTGDGFTIRPDPGTPFCLKDVPP